MPVWLTVMNSWVTFLKPLKIISRPWLLLKKSETTSILIFIKLVLIGVKGKSMKD